jgi:hypothetical protein
MIYIPSSGPSTNVDEQRYAKLFQTVDITTNFYFSYTYDLSRNLQENVLMARNARWNKNSYSKDSSSDDKFVWNTYLLKPFVDSGMRNKWTLKIVHGYVGMFLNFYVKMSDFRLSNNRASLCEAHARFNCSEKF